MRHPPPPRSPMAMTGKSITRTQLLSSAFILTVGCVAGIVAIRVFDHLIVEEAIHARKAVVTGLTVADRGGEPSRESLVRFASSHEILGVRSLRVLSPDGRVLASTDRFAPSSNETSPRVLEALTRTDGTAWRKGGTDGGRDLVVTSPVARTDGSREFLVVEFDMTGVDAKVRSTTLHVLLLVGAMALVNFLIVGWLVRRWMTPIAEMTRKMEEVQRGNLAVMVPEERSDEVGDLARHFNAMVEAIHKARNQSIELARRQANIEKFAALGRLSSGVAHEINNPVGGILTSLAVLRDVEPGSRRYEEYLEMMRTGLERIASIVSQLLRFSRQPRGERKEIDLNAMLEEVSVLARLQYRANRMHVIHRFGDVPHVPGAPDLLNQLFLNLVLNSLQEMADGGILTIATRTEDDHVAISFEDTGPGIPEANLERLFEPFFTTKEVGEGTGLGLSVALGIVEAHGGTIEAGNRPQGGARFTVRLPVHPVETDLTAHAGRQT